MRELQGGLEAKTESSYEGLDELMEGKKLLILDFVGTIYPAYGEPRNNLKGLLKYCRKKNIRVTISSDASRKSVFSRNTERYLPYYVDEFYGANSPGHIQKVPEDSGIDIEIIKNFKPIMQKYKVKPEETLVIGDTEIDEFSAKLAGVPCHIIDQCAPFDFGAFVPKYSQLRP